MKFQADKKHVSVTGRTIYREGIRYLDILRHLFLSNS